MPLVMYQRPMLLPCICAQSMKMDMLRSNYFRQKQGWHPSNRLLGTPISARLFCNLLQSLPVKSNKPSGSILQPSFAEQSRGSPGSNMFKITLQKFIRPYPRLHGITVQVPKIKLVYILWLIWTGTFRELTVVEWTRVSKEPRQQMAKSPQVQADNKEAMIKLVKCPLLCS